MKDSSFITLILVVLLGFGFTSAYVKTSKEAATRDALTFSETAEWDAEVYLVRTTYTPFIGEAAKKLRLPAPPKNSSKETSEELELLALYAKEERTPETLADIQAELELGTARFGSATYETHISGREATTRLFNSVLSEYDGITVLQKEYFDRVRPSVLDTSLKPVIPVPGHPAYPSGHAGTSMLIALILGELDAEHAEDYKKDALRIAHNREIAGVHYPSDSRAGQELALKYFLLLKKDAEFKELLNAAKAEW